MKLKLIITAISFITTQFSLCQTTIKDTIAKKQLTFSGSLGFSSNGFSITPTFSLNSPATMIIFAFKKQKFSIEPDIRLVPNASRGSMVFWFRYQAVQQKKYGLRIGGHPAFNIQQRVIDVGGSPLNISQFRRFLALEVLNTYKFSKHFSSSLYLLQGNGLQKDGPQTSVFLSFTPSYSGIKLSKNVSLAISPSFYYLNLDKKLGTYVSGAIILSHSKLPFTLQHGFNKTFYSNIPGNKDYLWNVSLHYNFKKVYNLAKK